MSPAGSTSTNKNVRGEQRKQREENHQRNDTGKFPRIPEFSDWKVSPSIYMLNERENIKPRLRNVN